MRPCSPDWLGQISKPMRGAQPHTASHGLTRPPRNTQKTVKSLTFDSNSTSDRSLSDVLKTLYYDAKTSTLAYSFFSAKELQHDIWHCNISQEDAHHLIDTAANSFWNNVLVAWASVHYSGDAAIASRFLWFNSLIRVNNIPVWYKHAYLCGLKYAHQLYHPTEQRLLNARELWDKYQLTIMQCNSLLTALPRLWRQDGKTHVMVEKEHDIILQRTLCTANPARYVYRQLSYDCTHLDNRRKKWEDELNIVINSKDFRNLWSNLYKITNIAKLRSFQYRLLNRALVLNTHLFRWGKRPDNYCTFCESYKESVLHLFLYCEDVKEVWSQVMELMRMLYNGPNSLTGYEFIFSKATGYNVCSTINFISLMFKQYVYRQRCMRKRLCFNAFKQEVLQMQNIERYNAVKNNRLELHNAKWSTVASPQ